MSDDNQSAGGGVTESAGQWRRPIGLMSQVVDGYFGYRSRDENAVDLHRD